jgi:hypothetical protein
MRLFIEIAAIYGVYVLGVSFLIGRFGTKDKVPIAVAASTIPILVVAAIFESAFLLITRKEPRVRPCPEGLDAAELIVERHRQQMFGGEIQQPKFAFHWARVYALTVEREARAVEGLARDIFATA